MRLTFFNSSSIVRCFLVVFLLSFLSESFAAEISVVKNGWESTTFQLDTEESVRIWEIRYELKDEEVQCGVFFTGREVMTTGSLEMVEDSLVRTRYTLKLYLRRGFMATGKGALHIRLIKGKPSEYIPLPPPSNLELATAPRLFAFRCRHEGTQVAVTVFKRDIGAPLWKRVLSENSNWEVPHDPIVVGGHYLLMASQCNSAVRYSPPALLGFRVEALSEKCNVCDGTGWLGTYPPLSEPPDEEYYEDKSSVVCITLPEKKFKFSDSSEEQMKRGFFWPGTKAGYMVLPQPAQFERSEICPYCRGTGVRLSPYPVSEPALPEIED
ncbi:MAG: hypothetical protein HQM10_22870 [Candidatus Riflebacteria bacterium]|nr:hypothetical protein [Candidatus Riflebacteria bacterium]